MLTVLVGLILFVLIFGAETTLLLVWWLIKLAFWLGLIVLGAGIILSLS